MAGNRGESFAPIAFGLIALGAALGFSTITPADAKAYQERFSAYLAAVQEVQPPELPAVVVPEATAEGQTPLAKALSLSTVRPHLDSYLPDPPAGWTARPTAEADYQALTGIAPVAWSEINPAIAEIEAEMAAHVAMQQEIPNRDRGFEMADVTYQTNGRMVMVSVRHLPARLFEGEDGAAFILLQELMRSLCTTAYAAEEFAVLDGLRFEISDVEDSAYARRINAYLGLQVDIEILTNADDAEVMAVLSQMDIVGLNGILETPLDTVAPRPRVAIADAR